MIWHSSNQWVLVWSSLNHLRPAQHDMCGRSDIRVEIGTCVVFDTCVRSDTHIWPTHVSGPHACQIRHACLAYTRAGSDTCLIHMHVQPAHMPDMTCVSDRHKCSPYMCAGYDTCAGYDMHVWLARLSSLHVCPACMHARYDPHIQPTCMPDMTHVSYSTHVSDLTHMSYWACLEQFRLDQTGLGQLLSVGCLMTQA